MRELDLTDDGEKLKAVLRLFDRSRLIGYADFDREINKELIPEIRYSKKQGLVQLDSLK